jgi:small conductance mechanosensitive channel
VNLDLSKIAVEQHLIAAVSALLILAAGWLIAGWIAGLVRKISERSGRISPTLVPLFAKLTRLAISIVVLVAALDKVGVDTSGLFALLGAAGLALGLALKDTMSDIAAGIMLLVLRPFDVGEAVDVGGSGGVVDAIDLFQTKLTSFEGVPFVINNSAVRTARIQNYSRAVTRRIDLEIGVSYGADLGKTKAVIESVLRDDSRVLTTPEFIVNTQSLGDSAVLFLVRCTTGASDFLGTKLDLVRAIKEALDRAGVEIPFPQRDVHLIQTRAA